MHAYRVVRETRRQQDKWISRYNVVFLVSCYSVTFPEAALHRCCSEKVFCKNAANLQEITHGEV